MSTRSVGVELPDWLVEFIDENKGHISRSSYVSGMLYMCIEHRTKHTFLTELEWQALYRLYTSGVEPQLLSDAFGISYSQMMDRVRNFDRDMEELDE